MKEMHEEEFEFLDKTKREQTEYFAQLISVGLNDPTAGPTFPFQKAN